MYRLTGSGPDGRRYELQQHEINNKIQEIVRIFRKKKSCSYSTRRICDHWYNILPDLPEPLPPLVHPVTRQPCPWICR